MASRKPLVLINGQLQQIPTGDTIAVPVTGQTLISQTNGESVSIVIGTPVYSSGNDTVKKAKADASGTISLVGLVYDTSVATSAAGNVITDGVLSATTAQWDAVAGTTGGLTAGTDYFLSAATAGLMTATAPSTAGQYVQKVGRAISTTEMRLLIESANVLL